MEENITVTRRKVDTMEINNSCPLKMVTQNQFESVGEETDLVERGCIQMGYAQTAFKNICALRELYSISCDKP